MAMIVMVMAVAVFAAASAGPAGGPGGQARVQVRSFLPVRPVSRAQRAAAVEAVIENAGDSPVEARPELVLPAGLRIVKPPAAATVRIASADVGRVRWEVRADQAGRYELLLRVGLGKAAPATASLAMLSLPPVKVRKLTYIPEPRPVKTRLLVGAHHCPLWEADKPRMWANVRKHPERTPALGFYAQENPQVADWETKWAVEHGISFFIYCWYRTSQGGPVQMRFGSAIHDALLKSKFVDKMKFTIMWENQARGKAGVADEKDLLANLLPFWMKHYFKHPSYLKVDDKPVLFIYRPEFLIQDLGGAENVARALGRMRQACRAEGFAGLHILGEYRGLNANHLKLMKRLGLDYTFAYCWHVQNNPTPKQAIRAQMQYIEKTQALNILPQVVTVSQGWSGWADEGSIWKLPPEDYKALLRRAGKFVAALPPGQLSGRMILLDNWNEWGEGHYIAPHREFGFGYLDAAREVFGLSPGPHVDLIPEDIGLGPYDTAYRAHVRRQEEVARLASKKARKAGGVEKGLIGWWAFDEAEGCPVALDYSGNRLGGKLLGARRAAGIDGSALVCSGGCVVVSSHRLLSPATAMSLECWVRTDLAGQDNKWFVNRVFGGGESAGYRMGVLAGKCCFEIPKTRWSHHLQASAALPTGRWVHVAGTFDGKTMRIYVEGREQGAMDRPGPVNASKFHLCLGTYEVKHAAHFTGLLDEVKLYDRALSADEVRDHYRRLAARAKADQALP